MNPAQKFYDSYDKNNIVLKLTNSYYHNKNLALIRNRKNMFKPPSKSIPKRIKDPMVKYRIEKDNEELGEKIKEITNRKKREFDNEFFDNFKFKLRRIKTNLKRENQKEIDKENELMYHRMEISKPFLSTKELDKDFKGTHKVYVKKLRKVNENGSVVLPKIYSNPLLYKRSVKTENKNDEIEYKEKEEIDDEKHQSKETKETVQETA
jgi:hypothetical protein